jgi:glycosyltransferase involved in cell wall biosynthesis
VGPVNDLDSLINCASLCADLPIRFLIMGEGPLLPIIKAKGKSMSLNNVFFIPYGSKEAVKDVLNITDACYVSFLHKPVLRTNSPNKFFDAVAAGKLIITNIQGWIRGLVEKQHIGFFADSDVPAEFREKIIPFLEDEDLLKRYQRASRRTAEEFFSREDLSRQFVACVENRAFASRKLSSIYSLTA